MELIREDKEQKKTKNQEEDFRTVLGIKITERGEGSAKGEIQVESMHLNPHGIVHGGCLFSLADTVSGAAVMGYGHKVTTVEGSIHFLRPGNPGGKLKAEARVVKHGRTFSVCDCQIFDDREKLVAATTMTFYHLTEEKGSDGSGQTGFVKQNEPSRRADIEEK